MIKEKCPFCFSNADYLTVVRLDNSLTLFQVACSNCGAKGPLMGDCAAATIKWNEQFKGRGAVKKAKEELLAEILHRYTK